MAWFTIIALAIGIPGDQFVGIVVLVQLVEAMSHVNARISYGWLGKRLLVSPAFHRIHHGIGVGHEGRARGCNFAVLFPVWDILFGTARFDLAPGATGIRDQQVEQFRTAGATQRKVLREALAERSAVALATLPFKLTLANLALARKNTSASYESVKHVAKDVVDAWRQGREAP